MTRRDPYSWTVVRLPERDLAELVLDLAAPLLERLGQAPAVDDARAALALAVSFWNANVLASKLWGGIHPPNRTLTRSCLPLEPLHRGQRARGEERRDGEASERWRPVDGGVRAEAARAV